MAQNLAVPTWPAYFLVPLGFGLAALTTFIRMVLPPQETGHQEIG
jgi:hypothetical protein